MNRAGTAAAPAVDTTIEAIDLERRGHARIAEGHAMLAKAAELRASESRDTWIPVVASPLGKRRTLALARQGLIESAKVGRKVVVRASSLDAFIEARRRAEPANGDEDLFGPATREPRPTRVARGR